MAFKMPPDDDTPAKICHCHHVVELKVKVNLATWLAAIVAVALLGLVLNKVGDLISLRLAVPLPPPTTGPRIYQDRTPEPSPGQHQP